MLLIGSSRETWRYYQPYLGRCLRHTAFNGRVHLQRVPEDRYFPRALESRQSGAFQQAGQAGGLALFVPIAMPSRRLSTILEFLLLRGIEVYMVSSRIELANNQFGFRRRCSTDGAVRHLVK